MMRREIQAGLSVGSGVAIGIMIAHSQSFNWFLGALVGGIVAYLSRNPLAAISAIPQTIGKMSADWHAKSPEDRNEMLNAFIPISTLICLVLTSLAYTIVTNPDWLLNNDRTSTSPVVRLVLILELSILLTGLPSVKKVTYQSEKLAPCRAYNPRTFWIHFVPGFYLRLLAGILRLLIIGIPLLILKIVIVTAKYFLYYITEIHNTERLVAMVDAAVLTAVFGRYLGSPLIGFGAGLAFGAIHDHFRFRIYTNLKPWSERFDPTQALDPEVSTA